MSSEAKLADELGKLSTAESAATTTKAHVLVAIPPELLVHVFTFVDDARSLAAVPTVCKAWRREMEGVADGLWRAQIARDFPLWSYQAAKGISSQGLWRSIGAGLEELPVQVINSDLREGFFGSALWERVSYAPGQTLEGDRHHGIVLRTSRGTHILSARARPPSGSTDHSPLQPSFRQLVPGQVVELQWKRAESGRFNWWFALVYKVLNDDELVLLFPQYASTGGQNAVLTGLETVQRTRETAMHGGYAGGIRVPSEQEVEQWVRCLGTSHTDVTIHEASRDESDGSAQAPALAARMRAAWAETHRAVPCSSLSGIRAHFREHYPSSAPSFRLMQR